MTILQMQKLKLRKIKYLAYRHSWIYILDVFDTEIWIPLTPYPTVSVFPLIEHVSICHF